MRNRRMRRTRKNIEELPLTPLIDTALTLLIIFMITSPMMHNAIKVNLPQGKAKEDKALKEQITVYIDKDGHVYLNETKTSLEKLVADLSQDALKQSEGTVYVKADKDVHYGRVIQTVDTLKVAGGVRYVALATQKQV